MTDPLDQYRIVETLTENQVFDVIVNPTHRKIGLGVKLMDLVVNHPKLQAVESLGLHCLPKMIPFYERWGFTDDVGEMKFMKRKKP